MKMMVGVNRVVEVKPGDLMVVRRNGKYHVVELVSISTRDVTRGCRRSQTARRHAKKIAEENNVSIWGINLNAYRKTEEED